jgi:hypothetical protein
MQPHLFTNTTKKRVGVGERDKLYKVALLSKEWKACHVPKKEGAKRGPVGDYRVDVLGAVMASLCQTISRTQTQVHFSETRDIC